MLLLRPVATSGPLVEKIWWKASLNSFLIQFSQDETGAFQQLNAVESFTWSRGWEKRPEYELTPTRQKPLNVFFQISFTFF